MEIKNPLSFSGDSHQVAPKMVYTSKKIGVIGAFFVLVLPKIPLAGMLKAYIDAKERSSNKKK